MTDTVKTEAQLLAAIPPEAQFVQTAEATGPVPTLTPQDVRDIIVSAFDAIATAQAAAEPSFAAYYFSSPAATTITDTTPVKAAGTTAAIAAASADITVATTNRITYSGTATRTFLVTATVALTCEGNGDALSVQIHKGGTLVTGAVVTYEHVTGANPVAVTVQCLVSLATSEYVELFVVNADTGNDITVTTGQVSALGLS